ncbi:hypothetical protein AD998_13890 [bacterium 336/3]|jgi:uncharacterized protein YqgV (UPF0045/DUF77 family)|nr:hypothetical protein AD998_13890 [bacterium 336/3]
MKISAELSLYPLDNDYIQIVLDFIESLKKNSSLEVITNGMSTQIFGDIDEVMSTITRATKELYEQKKAILVMKIGKGILKL